MADLPNLTKELLRRGYSESDVSKILGGNMLRVMEAIGDKSSLLDGLQDLKIDTISVNPVICNYAQ